MQTPHIAIEDHHASICQAIPGKALQQRLLAPKAIEQQAETFSAGNREQACSEYLLDVQLLCRLPYCTSYRHEGKCHEQVNARGYTSKAATTCGSQLCAWQ